MQGRGKSRDKRKRGEKNPYFLTKLMILNYLMQGEKRRREIRDYIRDSLGINDSSGIDRQLDELIEAGYIVKHEIPTYEGKGITPVCFRLSDGYTTYNGLKSIHMLFNEMGERLADKGLDIDWELLNLSTPVYQNAIDETIFLAITKDLVKVVTKSAIEKMLLTDEERKADPLLSQIHTAMNDERANQAFLENMLRSLDAPDLRKEVNAILAEKFDESEYADARNGMAESIADFEIQLLFGHDSPLQSLSEHAPQFFFPPNERPEVLGILKSSPSSLDLVLSLAKEEYEGVEALLNVYLIPYLPFLFEAIARLPEKIPEDATTKADTIIRELILERAAISGIPTPMLLILRSMFINDLFSKRLVVTEWVNEYISDLLRIRDFPYEDLRNKFQEIFGRPVDGRKPS